MIAGVDSCEVVRGEGMVNRQCESASECFRAKDGAVEDAMVGKVIEKGHENVSYTCRHKKNTKNNQKKCSCYIIEPLMDSYHEGI